MTQAYSTQWIEKAHDLIENDLINVTGYHQQILDQPAQWGNVPSYRLSALGSGKNWYQTRVQGVSVSLGETLTPQLIDHTDDDTDQDEQPTEEENEPTAEEPISEQPTAELSNGGSGGSLGVIRMVVLLLCSRRVKAKRVRIL